MLWSDLSYTLIPSICSCGYSPADPHNHMPHATSDLRWMRVNPASHLSRLTNQPTPAFCCCDLRVRPLVVHSPWPASSSSSWPSWCSPPSPPPRWPSWCPPSAAPQTCPSPSSPWCWRSAACSEVGQGVWRPPCHDLFYASRRLSCHDVFYASRRLSCHDVLGAGRLSCHDARRPLPCPCMAHAVAHESPGDWRPRASTQRVPRLAPRTRPAALTLTHLRPSRTHAAVQPTQLIPVILVSPAASQTPDPCLSFKFSRAWPVPHPDLRH